MLTVKARRANGSSMLIFEAEHVEVRDGYVMAFGISASGVGAHVTEDGPGNSYAMYIHRANVVRGDGGPTPMEHDLVVVENSAGQTVHLIRGDALPHDGEVNVAA